MGVIDSQESQPKVVFEKRVDAVQRTSRSAAGNCNIPGSDHDPQLFIAEAFGAKPDVRTPHRFTRSDENVPIGSR